MAVAVEKPDGKLLLFGVGLANAARKIHKELQQMTDRLLDFEDELWRCGLAETNIGDLCERGYVALCAAAGSLETEI